MNEKIKVGVQFRTFEITREMVNKEKRTAEISFSSEEPVNRWFGNEILDHSKGSVRLGRLKKGGPLLVDHNTRDQIGVVESVEIDPVSKKGKAIVRFSKSARAEEIFNDVQDGIRQNTSVGYQVHKMVLEKEQDGESTYRCTDWEPFEMSLVSVPADTTVGVGREQERSASGIEVEIIKPKATQTEGRTMELTVEQERKNSVDAERKRSADILAIGEKHNSAELARKAVAEGKSVEEFKGEVLELVYKAKPVRTEETSEIGMTDKEVKRFSVIRAINALVNPGDRKAREAAAFEFECSEAQALKLKKQPQGIFVPRDVQISQQRDLLKGTGSAGGYTVATDLLAASFIDLLRNRMMVRKMGATALGGLVGDIAIPRQSGGATAYWVGENVDVTESQQAFEQIAMTPKSIGAFTDLSRKLLLQSSVDVEGLVRLDLATVLALGIDLACISGLGNTGQPLGILPTSGIGDVAGGANGAAPTWENLVALETAVAAANADVNALGYLTNAQVRGKLKTTLKTPTYGSIFIWENLMGEPGWGMVNGYRAGVSNQISHTLTKGNQSLSSAIIFGNWADLIIGEWGGLDILVDPYTGGAAGTVRVRVLQDVDVAVRHPESFAAMQDALTA